MSQFSIFERDNDRAKFLEELKNNNEAICPCCERRARINKLKIHSTLAAMLMNLAKVSNAIAGDLRSWVHIEHFRLSYASSGNDFCICKHWGIVETRAAEPEEDKNGSGYYRLTALGEKFVTGEARIAKYAYTFDNRALKFSDETVDIVDSLNNKFSFSELLSHIRASEEAA